MDLEYHEPEGWTRGQTLCLIRELKKFPCLYSPVDINFVNKARRSEKLNLICDQLKLIKPLVTITEIKRKMRSLRAQLWKEKQKMLNFKRSNSRTDEMYEPKLWCFTELSFLLFVNDYKPSKSKIDLSKIDFDDSREELEEKWMKMENSKIPSHKKSKGNPLEERNDSNPSKSNIDLSEIDEPREELEEKFIYMENCKIPSQKKRKSKTNPLEEYDMGAIEFIKTFFELRPIKQPHQKEEEFCRYLCSLLKNIKLEETYDHLTLEILVLVKNTTTEERKQLQSENRPSPSPPFSTSKPHPIMTISSPRNCPDTFSSSNNSNTSSLIYPSLNLCNPQNINDPIHLESQSQTPIFASSKKPLGLSSTLTIDSLPQPKNKNLMYKFKPQTLRYTSSSSNPSDTPEPTKQLLNILLAERSEAQFDTSD